MAKHQNATKNLILLFSLAAVLSCSRTDPTHQEIIESDLLAILQQMEADCPAIDHYTYTQRHQYEIECSNQQHFRIAVDSGGKTKVIRLE